MFKTKIGILLIIVPLALILFVSIRNKYKKDQILNLSEEKNINSKLEVFSNKFYKFKYPSNFKIEDKPEYDFVSVYAPDGKEFLGIWLRATNQNNLSLEEMKIFDISYHRPWGAKYIGKTKIDGFETLSYFTDKPEYTDGPPKGLPDTTPYKVYFVYTNDSVYRVDYYSLNNANLFEDIISTLEFIKK